MIIELAQNTDLGRTRANATAWVATFVMIEVVALVLIVTQVLPQVLPDRLATQIGHNSESFVLAIILSLQVAWLRARRKASAGFDSQHRQVTADGATMFVVALCSIVIFAVGLLLLGLDNPRLKTLNEPVFAASFLFPYCALWPRRRPFVLAGVLALAFTLVFWSTDLVQQQAECLVALILAPWGFDLLSRWILRPVARPSIVGAVAWCGFLAVAPFALMVLKSADLGGFLDAAVLYGARGNEAFWGLFLVQLLALVAWSPRTLRNQEGVSLG